MRKFRLLLLASILAAAVFGGRHVSHAQDTAEYIDQTGHYVRGEILAFYRSIDNPVELYGYPITEAKLDAATGMTVQYFEKARIELHPAEPAGSRVRLTPLGEYLYEPGQPQFSTNNTASCQSFPPSGFPVCYDFLKFYLENGGPAQFGVPISNIELRNNIKVQYFQNARLEFQPGGVGQSWITVAKLGWEYFYKIGEDIKITAAVSPPGNNIPQQEKETEKADTPILRLQARAYPQQPVTARRATQTVYILLHDQRFMPVEAADVSVVVRWPSGDESRFIATAPTDARGMTKITFPVNSNAIGLVTVQVEGVYNRAPIKTVTSFRIWW